MDGALQSIEEHYRAGNNLFRQDMLDSALSSYALGSQEFDHFIFCSKWLQMWQSRRDNPKLWEIVSCGLRCLLNCGHCHGKLRNYASAVQTNTTTLDYLVIFFTICGDDDIVTKELKGFEQKALSRRSIAFRYTGEFSKALHDLVVLGQKYPVCTGADNHLRIRELQLEIKQDKRMAEYEGFPKEMINRNQALRLVLMNDVTRKTTFFASDSCSECFVSSMLRVKLAVGNELGLFHRGLYASIDRDHLSVLKCKPRLISRSGEDINFCKWFVADIHDFLRNPFETNSEPEWKLSLEGKVVTVYYIIFLKYEIMQALFFR
jgi:hypothetical protein